MKKLNTKKKIILGSKSPRRIELMKLMGFDFNVQKMDIIEDAPASLSPIQTAIFLSKKKANSYLIKKNNILVCADTIVYDKKLMLGKPKCHKTAKKMLEIISNQRHFVVTGVTLKTITTEISFYDRSIVYFKKLTNQEIDFYINNFNPLDKAGAYGIQDWIGLIGIHKITGSFYNVMGLPTLKVYEKLMKLI